jgi:hypothetical protein
LDHKQRKNEIFFATAWEKCTFAPGGAGEESAQPRDTVKNFTLSTLPPRGVFCRYLIKKQRKIFHQRKDFSCLRSFL